MDQPRVYLYTRVSTAMQIDGYSLDAQKTRMKAYADFNHFKVVGEYEDAGKSGKSIEGRTEFCRMMEDIKCGKDKVSYVLVFKLSRFGRNAADVLSTLQVMQDYGVNLVCVEDGIDSSKDAGKLMISVLSAVAEIERENIRVQTMEGRIQKAREGKWNGGFAPYGYTLKDGCLEINEAEAPTVRMIFDLYVNQGMGGRLIAQYLESHGIKKNKRQNTKGNLFGAAYVRDILKNPVYCGKIAYGRRKSEKVLGTRNDYRITWSDDYLLTDGLHQPLVSVQAWEDAQVRLRSQCERYKRYERKSDEHSYLLTGLVKCPVCDSGMYVTKSTKKRKDGTKYKDFLYYGCKHRRHDKGFKCDYKKQIPLEMLDKAVTEIITSLISKPDFARLMREKINMEVDTSALQQEIEHYEKQHRQQYGIKNKLMEELDNLDPDDRHYEQKKTDLDERLARMYDKIDSTQQHLLNARAKQQTIEAEKISGDNIYQILSDFDRLFTLMNERERHDLLEELISAIHVYPEQQPNGQWLKSIDFRLPLVEGKLEWRLDTDDGFENVILLSKGNVDVKHIKVDISLEDMDLSELQTHATYTQIKARVKEQTGLDVSNLYIAQVKAKCGIKERANYNHAKSADAKQPVCPAEKEKAIREALKYFGMI